jgi:DNA adenine methylase
MEQASLFPVSPALPKAVNVASVPQRSPFRYPGGKTWFVPTFRRWMTAQIRKPDLLVEPFAGGGIISLTALFEHLTAHVLMTELDEQVAAVWQCIVDGEAEWLAQKIIDFDLTSTSACYELQQVHQDTKAIAFQTILKNRIFHGGILAQGSGMIKNGEQGKGILSRWYPQTLAKRLRQIDIMRERLRFQQADGLQMLKTHVHQKNAVFFIDPPYTVGGKRAGKRLYKYADLDHEKLFSICEQLSGDFLMTYDNAEEVKNLARRHGFAMTTIAMKNTHHAAMTELVIGRDLSWLDALNTAPI